MYEKSSHPTMGVVGVLCVYGEMENFAEWWFTFMDVAAWEKIIHPSANLICDGFAGGFTRADDSILCYLLAVNEPLNFTIVFCIVASPQPNHGCTICILAICCNCLRNIFWWGVPREYGEYFLHFEIHYVDRKTILLMCFFTKTQLDWLGMCSDWAYT